MASTLSALLDSCHLRPPCRLVHTVNTLRFNLRSSKLELKVWTSNRSALTNRITVSKQFDINNYWKIRRAAESKNFSVRTSPVRTSQMLSETELLKCLRSAGVRHCVLRSFARKKPRENVQSHRITSGLVFTICNFIKQELSLRKLAWNWMGNSPAEIARLVFGRFLVSTGQIS